MHPLLNIAITAAREAGDFIMTQYGAPDINTKDDHSPVTQADMGAHDRILLHLRHTDIPVLSEESSETEFPTFPYPDALWIVDPLDGTRDFINMSGDFSVMIGLLEKGQPTLGVVYAPAHNTLFSATLGHGTYMEHNGVTQRLQVSNRTSPDLRFICSKNHFTPYMEAVAAKLVVSNSTPHGSVGIKASILGANLGDFFFYTGALGVWDVCAPQLIATEAGGTVTDMHGSPLAYATMNHRLPTGVVFSNTVCHEEVLTALHTTPVPL